FRPATRVLRHQDPVPYRRRLGPLERADLLAHLRLGPREANSGLQQPEPPVWGRRVPGLRVGHGQVPGATLSL
ncbi:hypothetical protein IscW_ISCW004882, partial [Ixodes scapularis]